MFIYIFIPLICPILCPLIVILTSYLINKLSNRSLDNLNLLKSLLSESNNISWLKANKLSSRLLMLFCLLTLIITLVIILILGPDYLDLEVFISSTLVIISSVSSMIITQKHFKERFDNYDLNNLEGENE
jgi:hypothetical protein